jgi:hypothetical protein
VAYLSALHRHAAWIALPALVASVLLLVHCIGGVIRNERQALIARVPLVPRQPVELPRAGTVVLATEGPILSRRFAGLRYELEGPDGQVVPGRPAIFRARTAGFRRAAMEVRVLEVRRPGLHELRVENLGAARPDDPDHSLLLKRPSLAASLAWVVGIVFSAVLAVASLVLLLLRLLGVG